MCGAWQPTMGTCARHPTGQGYDLHPQKWDVRAACLRMRPPMQWLHGTEIVWSMPQGTPRGVLLVLHACGQAAPNYFAASPQCKPCKGGCGAPFVAACAAASLCPGTCRSRAHDHAPMPAPRPLPTPPNPPPQPCQRRRPSRGQLWPPAWPPLPLAARPEATTAAGSCCPPTEQRRRLMA